MIFIKGKNEGLKATVRQFCNDWISYDIHDAPDLEHGAVSVLKVQLDPEEVAVFRLAATEDDIGMMFVQFDLSDDGRFTRRRP